MGRRPRRSPSGGRRRCGRRASCDITIIPRIRTGLRRSSRMRSGREAWRSGSAAVIKAATGCLRHTLARTAERRAVQQPDYPAAAGDLQELASVTVCARQPRRAALRPSRPTHSQAARHVSSWARTGHGAMSALSLLSGVKRKLDFGAVRSVVDPNRTSAESRASFHFHQELVRPATNATIFSETEIVR